MTLYVAERERGNALSNLYIKNYWLEVAHCRNPELSKLYMEFTLLHVYASSAVHSACDVGLDKAIMRGFWRTSFVPKLETSLYCRL